MTKSTIINGIELTKDTVVPGYSISCGSSVGTGPNMKIAITDLLVDMYAEDWKLENQITGATTEEQIERLGIKFERTYYESNLEYIKSILAEDKTFNSVSNLKDFLQY